jgi:hypothetical protein
VNWPNLLVGLSSFIIASVLSSCGRSEVATSPAVTSGGVGKFGNDGLIDEIYSSAIPVKPDPFLKNYPWASGLSRQSKG